MPRMRPAKTKKSAKKRFKITASGKISYRKSGRRHLLGHKSAKRKRQLGKPAVISETHTHMITESLPFDHRA